MINETANVWGRVFQKEVASVKKKKKKESQSQEFVVFSPDVSKDNHKKK